MAFSVKLLYLSVAIFFQQFALPMGQEYLVQNFTVEDGLPVNAVNQIVQDENGYIYFSTLDGLVRYDGYEFKIYNSGNTSGMVTNRIAGMIETDSNEIWMIQLEGIITRKKGETFTTFGEAYGDFAGNAIRIIEAEDGKIWISTTEGVFVFNEEAQSFYRPQGADLQTNTWALESAVGGTIFTVNQHGLVMWQSGTSSILLPGEDFPIPPDQILQLRQLNNNEIWVLGSEGFFRYSIGSRQVDYQFRYDDTEFFNIQTEDDGSYIVNSSNGFYQLHPSTPQVTLLEPKISTTLDRFNLVYQGLNDESIRVGDNEVLINGETVLNVPDIQSAFVDEEGNLWIATRGNGVFQLRKSQIGNISSEVADGLENIYPVIQSSDGVIWAGSFENGIFRFSNDQITNWRVSNSTLPSNLCRFLYTDADGSIYAGIWDHGLWRFQQDTESWNRMGAVDDVGGPNLTVEAMHRDAENRLFIGTNQQLIVEQNDDYRIFRDQDGHSFEGVRVIRENHRNTLFLGTNGNGLTVLQNGHSDTYTTQNSNLTSDFIRDIFVQSADTLWIATENLGLNRLILDDQSKLISVKKITTQDGLIHNSLHRIIQTPSGHLWVSSNSGLMRIHLKNLNRYADGLVSELSIEEFNEKDGMINREANGGVQTAGLLTNDQILLFPNQKGITAIDPSQISEQNILPPPTPIIEEVIAADSVIYIDGQSELQLPVGERNLRIRFSAPNLTAPDRIQFLYKMEEVNADWEYGNVGREAVLTNIPAGTHRFELRVNRIGETANFNEASVLITIPPRYYETAWFRLMILFLGFLFLYGGIRYRTRWLKRREKELQSRVNQQTRELQEAADQKSKFFSGITHELKTPLSLISSPLDDLIEGGIELSEKQAEQRLQLIKRNSDRLQNLVDQILGVSKLNADKLSLTFEPVDIVALTKQIVGQFQSKMQQKGIDLVVDFEQVREKIYIDKEAWERIIINLMSNAIRFSPKDSTIQIALLNEKNSVKLSIKDQGIGLNDEQAKKVFDYLYQADGAYSAEGTGIGLYLVKGLIDHMEGDVKVNSAKGEGAEFIVTLKKGYAHIKESDTIVHFPASRPAKSKEQNQKAGEIHPKKNGSSSRQKQILLVEDNDDFREYLHTVLSERYDITVAKEGTEALQLLENHKVDIVISDVMMPKMNGLEFVNNLRKQEHYQQLPVIFLSAKDLDTDKEAGLSSGADVYLTKPIKSKLLLSQIEALLRRENILNSNQLHEQNAEDDKLVKDVREIVYRHLANPALSVDLLADSLYVSRSKLYADWKQVCDTSVNAFIKKTRLNEAKKLIKEEGFSIQEAAAAVGFPDPNYFSTSFKKEFGVSPSEVMP